MSYRLRHWLHRRQRPVRFALLDGLLRTQTMTRAQVLDKQSEDLRQILRFAAEHTVFYRERLAGTLAHADGQQRGDALPSGPTPIAALPLLTKTDVIGRLSDLLADDADRAGVKIGHTGGSTGKPLAFYYDDAKHELMRAGMCRSYMMSGWQPGQKILNFWGARQDTAAGGVFGNTYGDFIGAEKTIPAHEYTDAHLQEWADCIRSYRPVLLQGYASILTALARFVAARGIKMPDSLLGVYSTAEVLNGWQRELMERAFGCKVFNQYGSREIPNIACECRHGQMHVFTDMVYLESLPIDGEDRLIVTSLTNRLMPFIRYDIGDSGQLLAGDCACGSPFPLMTMGMCRQNDLLRTPAGKRIHPSYFNRLLYGLTQIDQFQFVQNDARTITLNVVSAAPLAPEVLATLRESIRRDIDADMQLQLNYVAEIARTVSGKHRFVISHCA